MNLTRKASFGQLDLAARSIPVVLSTDYPVQRQGYIEILDHSKVDLSRGDLPLIESHDSSNLNIGVVRSIHVDGNKLRGLAVFGTSTRANEVLADVEAGIVTGVSIGYSLADDGQPVAGDPLARSFGFTPYECSVVAVPADPKAGFYRSRKTLTLQNSERNTMQATPTPELETRNHPAEISAIARTLPNGAELAMRSIEAGHTVEEFQKIAIRALSNKPLATADLGPVFSPAPAAGESTMRLLRSAADIGAHFANRHHTSDRDIGLADFMRGVARMKTTSEATRALAVGTDTAGGFTVPIETMGGVLQALVPASSLLQAGAAILPLSDGAKSYSFAATNVIPTASWRNENAQLTQSEPTFKNITVVPRDLAFMVKMSRELLADSPNAEVALQQAIAQALALEIDRAGLMGSGTAPEPRGLKNTVGIQTVTNGAAGTVLASYANFFSGVEKLLIASAPMPTAAIMAPRSLVKLGALADTTGQPLQVPSLLQNIKLLQTSQVPVNLTVGASVDCSDIYLGDFTQMAFAVREQASVVVNDSIAADYGQIVFVVHTRVDVLVMYPAAFCLISGVR